MKKDIRKEINELDENIGSVISKSNGVLQICYYSDLENVKDIVFRFLSQWSLLECFIRTDFIKTPKKTTLK